MSEKKEVKGKKVIEGILTQERVICEASQEALELNKKSAYGVLLENNRLQLSLIEALYLLEKKKIIIKDGRGKEINFEKFVKKASKIEPNFWIKYVVFRDMRNRGYVVKTALKFGADFRVYDRGVKPGEEHAKWVLFAVHEGSTLTWHEFAAKNRVAHSTKKKLLIGIVDDENDVTYYEVRWVRP